jgi:hypothetical protein
MKILEKAMYGIGILGTILLSLMVLLIVYMNVKGREVEKVCTYVNDHIEDPNVLSQVREADYTGPNLNVGEGSIYLYSVKWIGGPSCTVTLSREGKIVQARFLID